MRRVALVGAGFISRAHADALRGLPGVRLAAVIDPAAAPARTLAGPSGAQVFASVEAALAADAFDAAHVLVPPDLHRDVAVPLLAAGKPVLLEKPLAADAAGAAALVAAAAAGGATLGVNQNFVHHPAFLRLRALVEGGSLGRATHIDCLYNVPLRQMAARQFGHWMFARPVNLLLEQAVHPLSQIAALAGSITDVRALAGRDVPIGPGQAVYPTLDAILACEHLPAALRFAAGQSYPFWQLRVVCDDGVAVADILANRAYAWRRGKWMDAIDAPLSAARVAARLLGDGARNLTGYALGQLGRGGGDPFQASMRGSIAAFHQALDLGTAPALDGAFGAMLVAACERLAVAGFPAPAGAGAIARRLPAEDVPANAACRVAAAGDTAAPGTLSADPGAAPAASVPDIALLGGTGFIGAHLLRACLDRGMRVAVMARNLRGLPAAFADPRVILYRGDIRDPEAVARAIAGVPVVVNLAHGGGGSSWEQIRDAMVGGAETVARACLAAHTRRLIHVGSIASLYLGKQAEPVTGATPADPLADRRADYARAKAICDRLLLEMHAREGLPVVILRPGVVVGEGGPPFHGGLGLFNNEQHCLGWNAGRNPLPFVLAEDVATAILGAADAAAIGGRCYNLAGDVRPNARAYLAALGRTLGRDLRFHPQTAEKIWLLELGKWAIKRAGGRVVPVPSLRDLRSRGMAAAFDCTDAKRDLGWQPVADPAVFHARAIAVQAG